MIDNAEIMIKAQFRYMYNIANQYNSLTSNVLFGYSRGPAYLQENYNDSIQMYKKKKGSDYIVEGVNYVFKIFSILGDKDNKTGSVGKPKGIYFGYDKGEFGKDRMNLGMNVPPSVQKDRFTEFNAYIG